MVVALARFIALKEMLLIVPLITIFDMVQSINLYSGDSWSQYAKFHSYRIFWLLVCRVLLDPLVYYWDIYRGRLHQWIKNKAKSDDFYERLLKWFDPEEQA